MTMPSTPGEIPYGNEIKRKAIHIFALIMPIGYYFVPRPWALGLLFTAFLVSLTLDILRIFKFRAYTWIQPLMGSVLRPQEDRDFTGATYITFAGFFCLYAFPIPAAAAGMGFIILGDTAAALVGRRYGRHRFGHKSYEGSLAFFVCAALWAVILPDVPLTWGLAAAALATVVEATSGLVDDNVSVPLVSAAFLYFVPGWF